MCQTLPPAGDKLVALQIVAFFPPILSLFPHQTLAVFTVSW